MYLNSIEIYVTERPAARTLGGAVLAGAMALSPAPAAELAAVGVSVSDLGNRFFVQIARGVEQEAARLGGPQVQVRVVSNSYDLATQLRQIGDFVAAGVQMIVLNAADPQGVLPALDDAAAAGIVAVAVDVAAAGAAVTVTSDNRQAGRIACDYLVRRLKGKGQVVIINGPPVSSVTERVAGCRSVLDNNPGIAVLAADLNGGGSRNGGLAVMTQLLLAHPRIDAVFAINDPSALGADLAARQAGRDEFFIVSVDGAPGAIQALQDPASRLAATAAQDPHKMAVLGVRIGYEIMNGRPPAQTSILLPTTLVTRDNVARYAGWSVEQPPHSRN